jgi:hypothetical protein
VNQSLSSLSWLEAWDVNVDDVAELVIDDVAELVKDDVDDFFVL